MRRLVRQGMTALAVTGAMATASAQVTNDQLQAAKNEAELNALKANSDLELKKSAAEARKAIAEAERAEALAKIPPSTSIPLEGKVDTSKFGAAGLVKAFDLAQQLARKVCTDLTGETMLYSSELNQGIVESGILTDTLAKLIVELGKERKKYDDELATPKNAGAAFALPAIVGAVKAVADLTSLGKTNVIYSSEKFDTMAKDIFVTAMAEECPKKMIGLGGAYLGELDRSKLDALNEQARDLQSLRDTLAVSQKALVAKLKAATMRKNKVPAIPADKQTTWKEMVAQTDETLKVADALLSSFKDPESGPKNSLYKAAMYGTYAERTKKSQVLEFDIRLEGLTINKENMFTGQKVTLSGVAFLWYRLYDRKGTTLVAKTLRAITKPERIQLSGDDVKDSFFEEIKK